MFSLQVRIMFEVQDLKYATLATVSRCGMVWFSEDVLSTDMIFNNFLARLRSIPLDEGEDEAQRRRKGKEDEGEEAASPMLQVGTASSGPRVVCLPAPHAHVHMRTAEARHPLEVCVTPAPEEAQPLQLPKLRPAGEREEPCVCFLPPQTDGRLPFHVGGGNQCSQETWLLRTIRMKG